MQSSLDIGLVEIHTNIYDVSSSFMFISTHYLVEILSRTYKNVKALWVLCGSGENFAGVGLDNCAFLC